jgi:hypothetical protein
MVGHALPEWSNSISSNSRACWEEIDRKSREQRVEGGRRAAPRRKDSDDDSVMSEADRPHREPDFQARKSEEMKRL